MVKNSHRDEETYEELTTCGGGMYIDLWEFLGEENLWESSVFPFFLPAEDAPEQCAARRMRESDLDPELAAMLSPLMEESASQMRDLM